MHAAADFLKEYVDKGWLGINSGRGFYTYPTPAFQQPRFLTGEHKQMKGKQDEPNKMK